MVVIWRMLGTVITDSFNNGTLWYVCFSCNGPIGKCREATTDPFNNGPNGKRRQRIDDKEDADRLETKGSGIQLRELIPSLL
jgi:hypothetical protein